MHYMSSNFGLNISIRFSFSAQTTDTQIHRHIYTEVTHATDHATHATATNNVGKDSLRLNNVNNTVITYAYASKVYFQVGYIS